jgi:hypothetical protein
LQRGQLKKEEKVSAFAAWEIRDGWKKAEKERELIAIATKGMEAKAGLISSMVKQQFLGNTLLYIEDTLGPIEGEFRKEINSRNTQNTDLQRKIAAILELLQKINSMENNLASRCRV